MTQVDFRTNPPINDFVLLDTSILLAALHPVLLPDGTINHSLYPAHGDARDFLLYVVPQVLTGNTMLVVTELAIEESAHHITVKYLEQDISSNRYPGFTSWSRLYKSRPGVMSRHVSKISKFVATVKALPVAILTSSELSGISTDLTALMLKNMKRYNLMAADSYHLAVAEALDISMVATLDGDWLRACNDFTVLINR